MPDKIDAIFEADALTKTDFCVNLTMMIGLRNRLYRTARLLLFLVVVLALVVPQTSSISFCHPMDRVMLRSCCNPQKVTVKNGDDSIVNPSCCDEIALPKADKDSISIVALPTVTSATYPLTIPEVEWVLLGEVEPLPIVEARGPPFSAVPLYCHNCAYLI